MKCDLCNKEIEETFLGKLKGTVVKLNADGKNKIYNICPECQKKNKDVKEELRSKWLFLIIVHLYGKYQERSKCLLFCHKNKRA